MVVLQVKSTAYASSPSPPEAEVEEKEFLYECAASTPVADVATALGALAGLQARLLSLCLRLRERCADSGAAGELERALDEAEAYASKPSVLNSIEQMQKKHTALVFGYTEQAHMYFGIQLN